MVVVTVLFRMLVTMVMNRALSPSLLVSAIIGTPFLARLLTRRP